MITRLDYLSRREQAYILAVDRERLVAGLAGAGKQATSRSAR
jgi:hypothetical protein